MKARKPFPGAVLVGFMGSGKSAVGRALAKRLGAAFVDLDDKIESAAGKTVREIFAGAGEAGFREMERHAVAEAVKTPARVIAAGGGAFVDAGNRERLKGYGPVFYLKTSPETVLERLGCDRSRPLLPGSAAERERTVRELIGSRERFYGMADFTLSTDGRTVGEIADRILDLLRSGGKSER